MANQATSFVTSQSPSTPAQQTSDGSPQAKTSQKNLKFQQFCADLAVLHLLSAEELERRWLEVKRKNEDRLARGLQVNPYDR